MQFREFLVKSKACAPAIAWVGERTAEQAWTECERSDWLLWFIEKVVDDSLTRPLVSLVLACSKFSPSADPRVIQYNTRIERWLAGGETDTWTAVSAANAAKAALWTAASDSALAARVPRFAAWSASRAGRATEAELCALVREYLPWSMIGPIVEKYIDKA